MNMLDYVILGLITVLVIKGIFRGFFREVSSLAGLIVGLVIANRYHPQMTVALKSHIPLEGPLPVISFVTLFLLVFVFFSLLGMLFHHLFKRLFISWFDRSLGIIVALVKGLFISYLLIVILTFFMPSTSTLIVKSKAAHWVTVTYQSLTRLISPDLYYSWKKRIAQESKKAGKMISQGRKIVKKIPKVLPDEKE